MKRTAFALSFVICILLASLAQERIKAAACTPTGFFRDSINMTAALINPVAVSGDVDATGCNIGVYYNQNGLSATVKGANIYGANYFGILVNGDAAALNVDVLSSKIHQIGENPHNGTQHGIALYYRSFFVGGAATGRVSGNQIYDYQKGGIVVNGQGSQVNVMDNTVTGDGRVIFIAQNGVQIGYGSTSSVMRNAISGNSYDGHGDGSASAGVLVVGGPGYGVCPDGNDCPFTVNANIKDNVLTNNDVGVYFSNYEADFSAPADTTNNKAVNNKISNDQCFNLSYTAAISDVGNNDKMVNNTISGAGYTSCASAYNPTGAPIDASTSFTNRPKVHANK